MALKVFILKLKDKAIQPSNKRKVEHLLVKHSGIKIGLKEAILAIDLVVENKEAQVLFNADKVDRIQAAFDQYGIEITPSIPK